MIHEEPLRKKDVPPEFGRRTGIITLSLAAIALVACSLISIALAQLRPAALGIVLGIAVGIPVGAVLGIVRLATVKAMSERCRGGDAMLKLRAAVGLMFPRERWAEILVTAILFPAGFIATFIVYHLLHQASVGVSQHLMSADTDSVGSIVAIFAYGLTVTGIESWQIKRWYDSLPD